LVYGPSGAGKKTRIVATLKELYGPGVEKIKIDSRVFQTTSNRKLEFNIVASIYHLEITPSDVGNYDRVVVQDLLKEVAQTQQVDANAKQKFKVVVINEADHLTRDAQAALRRTMEKYSPNLRLILLANSTANIIAPIRSRTLLVRVAAPTEAEICDVLGRSGKKEGWAVNKGLNERIARDSGRNLRRALLMFEAVHAQKYGHLLISFPILPIAIASQLTFCTATKLQTQPQSPLPTGRLSSPKSPKRSWTSTLQPVSFKSAQSSTISLHIAYHPPPFSRPLHLS
jgi:DNA polymerase III delta prime subunit